VLHPTTSAIDLLDAVYLVVVKNFGIRGGGDCRRLLWSQIRFGYDEVLDRCYADCHPGIDKTHRGALSQVKRSVEPKRMYAELKGRDVVDIADSVALLKFYRSRCPPTDTFFLRPLAKVRGLIWFLNTPRGPNALAGTVKRLVKKVVGGGQLLFGGGKLYSSQSLRATTATRLFSAGASVSQVKSVTGHASDRAALTYNRVPDDQKLLLSSIVNKNVHSKLKLEPVSSGGVLTGLASSSSNSTGSSSILEGGSSSEFRSHFATSVVGGSANFSLDNKNCVINFNFGK